MRTRSSRAAPGLGLALALGLIATVPAWAQTSTPAAPGTPAPATPSATPPRAGSATAPLRLTLTEATALALRQQPTLRSAQGSLTAAQARVPQAR